MRTGPGCTVRGVHSAPDGHLQRQRRLCVVFCSAGTVLDNQQLRDKLSTAEQKFTTEFFVAMGRHLKSSVLDDLPAAYQSLVSTTLLH